MPLEGNPYLSLGCDVLEECAMCRDNGGLCRYERIGDGYGLTSEWNFTCPYHCHQHYNVESKSSVGVILGVSISMGLLFLTAIIYVSYKVIKKIKARRRRERFFKRIGGLLLKQKRRG